MTHLAIQEAVDGKNVDWMEKVSDEQYVGAVQETTMVERKSGQLPQPGLWQILLQAGATVRTVVTDRSCRKLARFALDHRRLLNCSNVLLVAYLFHPIHVLAVNSLLDRQVRHSRRRRCPVPMLLTRWNPHLVSRSDFLGFVSQRCTHPLPAVTISV